MPQQLKYNWNCPGCTKPLDTLSPLNADPNPVECWHCHHITDTSTILMDAEVCAILDNDIDQLLPKHKKIKRPLSTAQLRRYKSLERSEQDRVRRMFDGDDEE